MKHINTRECISKIERERINREKSANIYVLRTLEECLIEFAYSDDKVDHFILEKLSLTKNEAINNRIWQECLTIAAFVKYCYGVSCFVEDMQNTVVY